MSATFKLLVFFLFCVPVVMLQLEDLCFDICNCESSNTVNCSGQSLRNIPDKLGQGLVADGSRTRVILSHNNINTIGDYFVNITQLSYLDLSYNKLTDVQENSFFGMKLNYLFLSNQSPRLGVNQRSFKSLRATLNHLDLSYNNIEFLPSMMLKGFKNLSYVDLSHNNLISITEAYFDERHHTLELHSNPIQRISFDTFSTATNVRYINLGNISVATWEPDLFLNCAALQYLIISSPALSRLSRNSFVGLNSLLGMHIVRSSVVAIGMEYFYPTTNLQTLDLSENKLTIFNTETAGESVLANLILLNLTGNSLQNFTIDKKGNSFSSLQMLYLSHNSISMIDWESLSRLDNLQHIDLSSNSLTYINDAIEISSLRHLNLSSNSLISISYTTFAQNIFLISIDLSYNNLTSLYYDWWVNSDTVVNTTNNNWDCDCTLAIQIDILAQSGVTFNCHATPGTCGTCATPVATHGMALDVFHNQTKTRECHATTLGSGVIVALVLGAVLFIGFVGALGYVTYNKIRVKTLGKPSQHVTEQPRDTTAHCYESFPTNLRARDVKNPSDYIDMNLKNQRYEQPLSNIPSSNYEVPVSLEQHEYANTENIYEEAYQRSEEDIYINPT